MQHMQSCLAVLPSALHCCVLQQLPVHPRQWNIVATSCTELSEVVASERRRTAKVICDEHDLQTIHEAGELLLKLTKDGDTAEALRLMVAGAPVDWQSKLGRTALHLAAFGGKMELADALIGVGAQLDLQDIGGKTPLIMAQLFGKSQVALALQVADWYRRHHLVTRMAKHVEKGRCMSSLVIYDGKDCNRCDYLALEEVAIASAGTQPLHSKSKATQRAHYPKNWRGFLVPTPG